MKIIPVAFDSLGTRAMATYIETDDVKIFIDPSVRLAPLRYNLAPHPVEIKRRDEHWQQIINFAQNCDVIIVTHYHYDHHNPDFPELFQDKFLIVKHPTENINFSQKERAQVFLKRVSSKTKKIEIAEEGSFYFNKTKIFCSKAVYHGTSHHLGYVIEVLIDDTIEKLLFTSDVCGIPDESHLSFIIQNNPDIIICDGPSLYLKGYRYSDSTWQKSVANMARIIKETEAKIFIIDHHLTRDLNYQIYYKEVRDLLRRTNVNREIKLITAAEFLGKKTELLEARRRELYITEENFI
ncbi:MAG: hypothetical protein N2201_00980 [candidate division WOR-3 bacterium]|nr:hypothetical protein [candidate division WOR-3 bacterium]